MHKRETIAIGKSFCTTVSKSQKILTLNICLILYILHISSLFKVDLHLAYKKRKNINNNTAYIFVNKLSSNNNNNNKTEYLIVRQNQHVANGFYITYMGNQASTFLFFVWKIWDYHNFLLFQKQLTIFLELCKMWFRYHILQNWDFYFIF